MTGPRPGTLEWLADLRPAEVVLVDAAASLDRATWEERANALAAALAADPPDPLVLPGAIGPGWAVQTWAAAKLGLSVLGAPPTLAALPGRGATPAELGVRSGAPHGGDRPHTAAQRRLSGSVRPPDAYAVSAGGRVVRRSFDPERVAAVGPALADLVARLHLAPGTTLVAHGPASDVVVAFAVNVALVGGGRVVTAPSAAEALALGAERGATLAALSPAALEELARLDDAEREALDVLQIAHVITGGARPTPEVRAAAEDLFGADALLDVYATADAGVVAVAGGDRPHRALDGVEVRPDRAGRLEVRSPLAVTADWTATGDRVALEGDAAFRLG